MDPFSLQYIFSFPALSNGATHGHSLLLLANLLIQFDRQLTLYSKQHYIFNSLCMYAWEGHYCILSSITFIVSISIAITIATIIHCCQQLFVLPTSPPPRHVSMSRHSDASVPSLHPHMTSPQSPRSRSSKLSVCLSV